MFLDEPSSETAESKSVANVEIRSKAGTCFDTVLIASRKESKKTTVKMKTTATSVVAAICNEIRFLERPYRSIPTTNHPRTTRRVSNPVLDPDARMPLTKGADIKNRVLIATRLSLQTKARAHAIMTAK